MNARARARKGLLAALFLPRARVPGDLRACMSKGGHNVSSTAWGVEEAGGAKDRWGWGRMQDEAGEAEDSGGAQGAPPGVQDLKARAPTQGAHENRWTKSQTKQLGKNTAVPDKKTGLLQQKARQKV